MKCRWFPSIARLVLSALAFFFNVSGAQAGENVILQFNHTEGSAPISGLTSDGAGNLYGTTTAGGKGNCGTVFELSPGSAGKWTETVLYSFRGCRSVSQVPYGTLAIDKEGNLYGTQIQYFNSGQIFELMKGANGTWSYSIIHNFGTEGTPLGDLTWDASGNLYGATAFNSTSFNGEVFELSPQPNGNWNETVLYTFPAPNGVGFPVGGVIFDSKGNLYGAAGNGSNGGFGAAYELSPQASGPWALTVLHNFDGSDGSELNSRLVFDSSGNLYGTATDPFPNGEVFELIQSSGGKWKEETIYTFASGSDGSAPQGTLVFDASGNLYGTTARGGLGCNGSLCGVVYRLSPQSGGGWKETILHTFESADDGSAPGEGLLVDNAGHLFGTTIYGGGRFGYGTVFEITP